MVRIVKKNTPPHRIIDLRYKKKNEIHAITKNNTAYVRRRGGVGGKRKAWLVLVLLF